MTPTLEWIRSVRFCMCGLSALLLSHAYVTLYVTGDCLKACLLRMTIWLYYYVGLLLVIFDQNLYLWALSTHKYIGLLDDYEHFMEVCLTWCYGLSEGPFTFSNFYNNPFLPNVIFFRTLSKRRCPFWIATEKNMRGRENITSASVSPSKKKKDWTV